MEVQFAEWKFRFVFQLQYLKEFSAILWTAALSKCTINTGYLNLNLIKFKLQILNPVPWNFSGGPVAKTLHSQCRGSRFDTWSGNQVPDATTKDLHATTKTQHGQIKLLKNPVPQSYFKCSVATCRWQSPYQTVFNMNMSIITKSSFVQYCCRVHKPLLNTMLI